MVWAWCGRSQNFYLDVAPAVHEGHGGGGRGSCGRARPAAATHRHLVQVGGSARPARACQAEKRDSVTRNCPSWKGKQKGGVMRIH